MSAETDEELLDRLWLEICDEAALASQNEPVLASFYHATVLNHKNFICALAFQLAAKLDCNDVPAMLIRDVIEESLLASPGNLVAAACDMQAYLERDPACDQYLMPFLYFKGFHAIQTQRAANYLWQRSRKTLALFLQTRAASVFAVDIHPAVGIGRGVMLDHATGLVAGETSRIGDNVSILHQVTLGGTGTGSDLRHPQIGNGVLLAAGATLLGPVHVGENAKVAAGSLVLQDVPPRTTVAGVPAKAVGRPIEAEPSREMDQGLD